MGGYGILDLASTYPNLFAALIPICGGTILNQLQHLKKIPIWMFHGEKRRCNTSRKFNTYL